MKEYSYLFFDCDGVILNSNNIKTEAFFEVAKEFGIKKANKLVEYHINNGGISRFQKIKYFQENIIFNNNKEIYKRLIKKYGEIVKKELLKSDISDGIYEIRNFFPKSNFAIISGSDQTELRWVFRNLNLDYIFNLGIYGSPLNKKEIVSKIYSENKIKPNTIFFGDSLYDYEVAKYFDMDFVFISDWTELKEWREFTIKNKIETCKNLTEYLDKKKLINYH